MRMDTKSLDDALRGIDIGDLSTGVRESLFWLSLPGIYPSQRDLAERIAWQMKNELPQSHRLVQAVVDGGWVTLAGQVEWNYQKNGAEAAARRERRVKGISNAIRVQPGGELAEVNRRMDEALRQAEPLRSRAVLSWAHHEAAAGAGSDSNQQPPAAP